MSNYLLNQTATKIEEALSGANLFLNDVWGYTGNANLIGTAYLRGLNVSGLAVSNDFYVTGDQFTFGAATFYDFSNIAHLNNTGTAYISNLTGFTQFNDLNSTGNTYIDQITGGVKISGDTEAVGNSHFVGNIYNTGTTDITGVLLVNGISITGNTTHITNVSLTGSVTNVFQNKGELLVGTGVSGASLVTVGATSGLFLKSDPSQSAGVGWSAIDGGGGLTYLEDNNSGFQSAELRANSTYHSGNTNNLDIMLKPFGSGGFGLTNMGTGVVDYWQPTRRLFLGTNAVDLQIARDENESINFGGELFQKRTARGAYSTIGGGYNNMTEGDYSFVAGGNNVADVGLYSFIGGYGNVSSGDGNVILGHLNTVGDSGSYITCIGSSNTVSASTSDTNYTVIGRDNTAGLFSSSCSLIGENLWAGNNSVGNTLFGISNTGDASHSIIIGYNSISDADADYSVVLGREAKGRRHGELVYAAGRFTKDGDAQSSLFCSRRITTNATQTELFTDGSSKRITLEAGTTSYFTVYIVAKRTDVEGEAAAYKIEGCLNNVAGTTALVGAITKTVIAEDTVAWDATVEANDGLDSLLIKVTGEASKTIRWVAKTEMVEVLS